MWTPSDSAWATATTTAPVAVVARLRRRSAPSAGRAASAGSRSQSPKTTPPTATAWPQSARPRSRTSTKPATRSGRTPPGAHPEEEQQEDRRAGRGEDEEPVHAAERGERDDHPDEVAVGHGLGDAVGRRRADPGHDVEHRAAEDARGRGEGARDRHGPERERPRRVDRDAPAGRDAGEDGDVHQVVAPEVENRAAPRLEELEPRELAVAPVEDRVRQEEEGAGHLPAGRDRQEERRAREADRDAHERHRVGRHPRPEEPARERERDPALDVARHEPLALLDEAPEEPALRGGDVGHRRERKA